MKQFAKHICYSGGAEGADTYFEFFSNKFAVDVIAYSYKTKYHTSENKYELNEMQFAEGVKHVHKANLVLKRAKVNSYLKLLARNWFQVKNADEVFAISILKNTANGWCVQGGTAWAVQMAINTNKPVFVFDQDQVQWFYYDYYYKNFKECVNNPKITALHFAGIGTRNINLFGINAIENLFKNTFE